MEGLVGLHQGVTCTPRFGVLIVCWRKQRFSHRFLWVWIILCCSSLTICPATTLAVISMIWALETVDSRAMWTYGGSLYQGLVLCLHCCVKDVVFVESKYQLSAWICVCEGQWERECCLFLTSWPMSFLFLSRHVLPLQVKRGCLKEIYLQHSYLHSQWIWGYQHTPFPAVRSANLFCQAFHISASFFSQFRWSVFMTCYSTSLF